MFKVHYKFITPEGESDFLIGHADTADKAAELMNEHMDQICLRAENEGYDPDDIDTTFNQVMIGDNIFEYHIDDVK